MPKNPEERIHYKFDQFHELMPRGRRWWDNPVLTRDLEKILNSSDETNGLPLNRNAYQDALKQKFDSEQTNETTKINEANAELNRMLTPIVELMVKKGYSREKLLKGIPHDPKKR